ncbi:MAG: hypothetical protein HY329_12610 [Chloroflexi bacterium]|nr:hypothetical protein [Chloroflexota bacterium]
MPEIPFGITALFLTIIAGVVAAFVTGTRNAGERLGETPATAGRQTVIAGTLLAIWLAVTAAAALSGILQSSGGPPPLLAFVGPAFVVVTVLAWSRFGTRLADGLSLAGLVGYQVFRVPLELVLYWLHVIDVVPVQMTFEGLNFDVVSGLSAAVVAWLAAKRQLPAWALLLWNVVGFALVLTIVVISILSAPGPLRTFTNEPANTFVSTFPYVWLATFLVPAAIFGHLLVFRRWWRDRQA